MSRSDKEISTTLTRFAADLLILDATAHHYGRRIDRGQLHGLDEWLYTPDGAFMGLAGMAHRMLIRNLQNPEFTSEVERQITARARRAIRHHRRGKRSGPRPPIPTVALAFFQEHHRRSDHPAPCYPWWCGDLFNRAEGDEVPDISPYGG